LLKKQLTYILMILFSAQSFAQSTHYQNRFWKLTDVSGELRLKGQYREQETVIQDFKDSQKSLYYSGGITLYTRNYIWNPNFMTLDVGGEYSPESDMDNYIVAPDRAEIRTLKGFNIASTHFSNSLISLTTLYNFSENYSNRENLTNLKSNGNRWGGTLFFKSKILPIRLSYDDMRYDQKEIETDFSYQMMQKNFVAETQRSFGKNDRNELRYTNSNYARKDYNNFEVKNKINNVSLLNQIYFDQQKRYSLYSYIYNNNQRGDNVFNIFNVSENAFFILPHKLSFNSDYNYYNLQMTDQSSILNKISGTIAHTLFKSLTSSVNYEYSNNNHTFYNETRNTARLNINYVKTIPTGVVNIGYQFQYLNDNMKSEATLIPIFKEYHILTDGNITMLDKSFVDESTIVVRDVTGTIIYRRDFDYILINQGEFTEIQRMPGGQISNAGSVYIDYLAKQSGAYSYDAFSNRLSGNINLFQGFLKLYSTVTFQNYKNIEYSDFLTLNYLKQYFYGTDIDVGFADGGIEFDHYFSTITPYKMTRYFLNVQGNIKEKLLLSLNGNIRNYYMIDEDLKRNYSDLSGNITYRFSQISTIDLNLGYRNQKGEGIDLELLTGRSEFKTVYRKLFVIIGLEFYKRNYLNEKINFNGAYLQLARKF